MKQIVLADRLLSDLSRLKKTNPLIFARVQKQFTLFQTNPRHPSLRTHKLTGALKNTWSISVTMEIRLIYIETDTMYYFFKIGTHDQVYK